MDGLWSVPAPRTGCVVLLVEPGGVGGQVTLPCSHVVDYPCHKVPQAHEGVRGDGREVLVVWRSGRVGGPVLEKHVPSPVPKSPVGLSHEFGGGISVPGRGGAC